MPSRIVAIQGLPGSGKTTLVEKCFSMYKQYGVGFITKEVRDEKHKRIGFDLYCLPDGPIYSLARVDWRRTSQFHVGKYGVKPENIEYALDWIDEYRPHRPLLLLDELGKMEAYSCRFNEWLLQNLPKWQGTVIMTLPISIPHPFQALLKNIHFQTFSLTRENRDVVFTEISKLISHTLAKS